MRTATYLLLVASLSTGCTHGALKVAAGLGGPWIVTNDGAIYAHGASGWERKEDPGAADDLALCGTHLFILTQPNAQGYRAIKSRDVFGSTWTTYPSLGLAGPKQIACHGDVPVALTGDSPVDLLSQLERAVYMYDKTTQSWAVLQQGASAITVENGRLFYLHSSPAPGNVWSKDLFGAWTETRWGTTMVASRIAGDANGFPWVATSSTSNPLFKWDTANQKWTFGFSSGPVYDMDIESYVRMYVLSDPQTGGGYTVYSHDLYSGGWTTYSLPSY